MTITETFVPESVEDQEGERSSGGSSRKRLILAAGAAAAIGLGAGLYFMFGTGGSDDAEFRLVPPVSSPQAVVPSTKPVVTAPAPKVGTRDPFKVLKPGAAPAPVAVADTTTSASSTSGNTTAAVAGPIASPSAAPASSVTLSVTSINLATQTAVIDVDGKKYATAAGKTFASTFTLYSVFNAQCVGVLYGSASTPVCLANPVTVSS
jgi:hypothetical protein